MRRKMAGLLVLIVSLGLASVVASRERVQRKLVDEVQALAANEFERPTSSESTEASVRACLDRRADAGVLMIVFDALAPDGGLTDAGAQWLANMSPIVDTTMPCFNAPAVGGFDEFGVACASHQLDRTTTVMGLSAVLAAQLAQSRSPVEDLETCRALVVVERDSVALAGLIGGLSAATQAKAQLRRCVVAIAHSTPAERARLQRALESAESLPPFSDVVRVERDVMGLAIFGATMRAGLRARLPRSARACIGTLTDDSVLTKARLWLSFPTYWDTMVQLEKLSRSSPTLSGPEVHALLEHVARVESFFDMEPSADPMMPTFARRYQNLSRSLEAQLAVLELLDGKTVPPKPWMRLSLEGERLSLEIDFDDGPQLVEVDAIRQANERAPSLGADVPGR